MWLLILVEIDDFLLSLLFLGLTCIFCTNFDTANCKGTFKGEADIIELRLLENLIRIEVLFSEKT